MKNILKTLLLALISIAVHAQQATVIDAKSITLARYTNLAAIQTAIPAPQTGMQVYNTGTATNWFYNGSSWVNLAMATSAPTDPEGFGSWGCDSPGLKAYQPVGKSSSILVGQNFGRAVAISGNYAIVGMSRAATFYKLNVNTGIWEEKTTVFPTTIQATNDIFGSNVAISGDYAMVSAYLENINGFNETGTVSVYKRNTSTDVWEFQTKLINTGQGTSDYFGTSIAMSGQYAIIGASGDDAAGFTNCGSASVFKLNTSTNTWLLEQQLFSNIQINDSYFGGDVTINNDVVIIGGGFDDPYIRFYNRSGSLPTPWVFSQTLNGSINGNGLAISGDFAVIAANTTAGFAQVNLYKKVFGFFGTNWILVKTFDNIFNGTSGHGYSLVMSGDFLMIGAQSYNIPASNNIGAFEVYKRHGDYYTRLSIGINPGAESEQNFGSSLAIDSNGRFLVGGSGKINTTPPAILGTAVFGKVK